MKDLQRELEDSRAAQKEVQAVARESERRSKVMEADMVQLHEVTLITEDQRESFFLQEKW